MQWHDATITTRVYFMWYYYTILCANVFKFAIITEKFLLNKWIKSIFTSQCCFFCAVLGCFLLQLIHASDSLATTHPSEVTNVATVCIFVSTGWALSQGMAGSTISTCLSSGHFMCSDSFLGLSLYIVFTISNLSNSFVSVRLFIMADRLFGLLLF